jgi:hypothetical protein
MDPRELFSILHNSVAGALENFKDCQTFRFLNLSLRIKSPTADLALGREDLAENRGRDDN